MTPKSRTWLNGAIWAAIIACVALGCRPEGSRPAEEAGRAKAPKRFLYVFSPEGAFVKLDAATLSLVGNGNLGQAEVHLVEGIIPDPEYRDLLIETSRAWSKDASGPAPGLVVVRAAPARGASPTLHTVQTVAPPAGMDQLIGGILTRGKRRLLVTTWGGPGGATPAQNTLVMAEDGNFHNAKPLENFAVGPGSCVASDGSRIYAPSARALLEIRSLDTRDLAVRTLQSQSVAMGGFSPFVLVGSRGPCRVLVVGRPDKPPKDKVELPAYIYDLENQTMVRRLTLQGLGEYSLSPDGSLVVVDERTVVPNLLPSGTVVGVRYKKTGVVRVYDAAAGTELAAAKLPEDGQLSAIEGSTGYYVSPRLLSIVGLRNGKTTITVKLPFARGFVAFHDET